MFTLFIYKEKKHEQISRIMLSLMLFVIVEVIYVRHNAPYSFRSGAAFMAAAT